MVAAGADTETLSQTQIVYDPIYDHKERSVASCIVAVTCIDVADRGIDA